MSSGLPALRVAASLLIKAGLRGNAIHRGLVTKPACDPTFERSKARPKEIGANLMAAIELALNFGVRMKSMKGQDDSPVILLRYALSGRIAFATALQTLAGRAVAVCEPSHAVSSDSGRNCDALFMTGQAIAQWVERSTR